MGNQVLEGCYIDLISNMLLIESWKSVIGPLLGNIDLTFGGYDEDFVWGHGLLNTDTPGLIEDHLKQHCSVNVGGLSHEKGSSNICVGNCQEGQL